MATNPDQIFYFAIDGNEANVVNRVGSNVYAFNILKSLEKITKEQNNFQFTILLNAEPVKDLPNPRAGWQYQIVTPAKFWTQWALPIHLFFNQKKYDVLFTPGHYAPRLSPIPYISSVMDLGFLKFPDQFKKTDLLQLSAWTKYSVKKAQKIICISEFTKKEVAQTYKRKMSDLIVAYPAVNLTDRPATLSIVRAYLRKHKIKQPYFLYLGTLQPRKNLLRLIEAFEIFSRKLAAINVSKNFTSRTKLNNKIEPQLLIGGKIGWLAEPILNRVKQSPFKEQIKLLDFVPENLKPHLYQQSLATILIGLYEGFGIPPLEAIYYQNLPIVSNLSSLPEVVGKAGLTVDPYNVEKIAQKMLEVYKLTAKQRAILKKQARLQIEKFSWDESASKILNTLVEVSKKNHAEK